MTDDPATLPSKFSETIDSFSHISRRRCFSGVEIPNMNLVAINFYFCPKPPVLVQENALYPRGTVATNMFVSKILSPRADAKIYPAIIEGVHVDVIYIHPIRGIKQKSMHTKATALSIPHTVSDSVDVPSASNLCCGPCQIFNKRYICNINDCNKSHSKWDNSNFTNDLDWSDIGLSAQMYSPLSGGVYHVI